MRVIFALICTLAALVFVIGCNEAHEPGQAEKTGEAKQADPAPKTDAKPKFTIKQVMQKGQGKAGVYQKIVTGKASVADKDQMVDMFVAMSLQTPKKGSTESWKEKTTALVDAAKSVAKGDAAAVDKLKTANDCNSCHRVHR